MKRILFLLFVTHLFLNAQSGDCPPQLICVGFQSGINMSAGFVNEINATNRGCLAASEATASYWFQLCVNSTGTIAFDINPNGAGNDYDFAVYGPGASCPPTTAPMRCSFAATPVGGGPNGDITGIRTGNVDLSEGPAGNGFVAPINANAGECYIISVNNYAGGSSNFSIQQTGTAGFSCIPLPVDMMEFKGEYDKENNRNIITWSTYTEVNNDYFTLEASEDLYTYRVVQQISGNGNSNTINSYVSYDNTQAQYTYYRIKQTDYDGNEKYYGPIIVSQTGKEILSEKYFDCSGRELESIPSNGFGCYFIHIMYKDGTSDVKKLIQ